MEATMPDPTAKPIVISEAEHASRTADRINELVTDRLDHLFSYHAPTPDQIPKYEAIRAGGKAFAKIVMDNTPGCADQSAALRHIRDACFAANASIALGGKS